MTGMDSNLTRVAVLSKPQILTWQILALERLVDETFVDITTVVVEESAGLGPVSKPKGSGNSSRTPRLQLSSVRRFVNALLERNGRQLVRAEHKLAWLLGGPSKRWELEQGTDVEEVACFSGADFIYCEPQREDGSWTELPDSVVDSIANNADVVIRFGFGLIKGRILTEPRYGVLSFHPDDIRNRRGLGPSLAFLNGEEELSITLQRITDKIDGGEIVLIDTISIRDAHSLDNLMGRVKEKQIEMLTEGIKRLQDPNFEPERPDELGEYRSIKRRENLSYGSRIIFKNIVGRLKRNLGCR